MYASFLLSEWLHLFREKEEAMTRQQAFVPLVSSRIIIESHHQVKAVLKILVDDLDAPSAPLQQQIKGIGQAFAPRSPWAEAYACPRPYLASCNRNRLRRRVIFAWKDPAVGTGEVHDPPSSRERSPRIVPWSCSHCSGVICSTCSKTARPRASARRICSFSSSVS